jgi:surface protein
VTPIPAYTSFQDLITQCLIEEYYTGECTAFASATNYGTMPNWDTSLVTDMSGDPNNYGQGFSRGGFNGDISRWNTEKVTDMSYIFRSASAFNQDIGSWNTAQVTTMRAMFYQASAFNQDIGSWNTAEVTNMEYICLVTLLRSTTTFPRGLEPQQRRRKEICFSTRLRFKRNLSAPTPKPVRRIRA